MILRTLRESETDLLKEFLYEAIFLPEGTQPPDRSIVERPELSLYYENFGSGRADNCIVAEQDGRIVGAVWTRIMDDYGHVDDDTPSLAISLYKECRGQGIGTQLMMKMLERLKQQGYARASLAVQKANYAVRLYEKVGFQTVGENDEEYIMACELQKTAGQKDPEGIQTLHPKNRGVTEETSVNNLSPFCTCTDEKCPLHPTNHEKGCAPCIEKNLKSGEIPSCFFKKLDETKKPEAYYFEDFAKAVMDERKKPVCEDAYGFQD